MLCLLFSSKNPDRLFKEDSTSFYLLMFILAAMAIIFTLIGLSYIGYYCTQICSNFIDVTDMIPGMQECYYGNNVMCGLLGVLFSLFIFICVTTLIGIIIWGVQLIIECKKAYSTARRIQIESKSLNITKKS